LSLLKERFRGRASLGLSALSPGLTATRAAGPQAVFIAVR